MNPEQPKQYTPEESADIKNVFVKKFFQYVYLLFAVLVIIYFYWDESLLVIITLGSINLFVFALSFYLLFKIRSEKKWINVLKTFFSLTIIILAILFVFLLIKAPSFCLSFKKVTVENIFSKKVEVLEGSCHWRVPWWYRELPPSNDPGNPYNIGPF